MRKVSRKSVKPKMSPEDEYELHDRHDASYERQMQAESTILKEVVSGLYAGIAQSAMDKLKSKDFGKKKKEPTDASDTTTDASATDASDTATDASDTATDASTGGVDLSKAGTRMSDEDIAKANSDYMNNQTSVQQGGLDSGIDPSIDPKTGKPFESKPYVKPPAPAGGYQTMDPDGNPVNPPMPWESPLKGEEKRSNISPSGANESMFHVASVLREDDEDYSDDEISRDKDPDAAGGPYSEDDIKVTQDPRDAAPGMDPVADPPTLQAKQVTTGMAYKAPAATGTMQTMLPGGEHDAIQKQYPDLIEGLCGGSSDMKGGFLTDPKDKKKAMAAMALMSSLDKKLKEDKKTRLKKILNTKNPPAMPGAEGY